MTDLDGFLTDLASGAPVPGGGSVAALEVAMAAALLSMVANLTIGRKRYAAVQEQVLAIREQAQGFGAQARQLIDEDSAAYGAVSAAMALSRETDEEKRRRSEAIQAALMGAAQPPLQTMGLASAVVALAGDLVPIGNPSAISDVGTAVGSALAGYDAARLNVEINLAAVRDDEWVGRTREEMNAIPPPHDGVETIMQRVEAVIRGDA